MDIPPSVWPEPVKPRPKPAACWCRVERLLKLANLDCAVPDYKTLCWREKTHAVQIPYRRADGPLNLLFDGTGIRFLGIGEWQAGKPDVRGRRQWRKVRLGMETATSDIRAVELTPGSDGDSPVLPKLLGQIPEGEEIGIVTADGAFDTRRCHTAIIDRPTTEIQIRMALMNRFSALGAAEILRVA